MKNKLINNYFSKIAFFITAIVFCFLHIQTAHAMFGFGGILIFELPTEVCNGAPQINVHVILQGDTLMSLYDSPATRALGDSNSTIDVSQVGTYIPLTLECMVVVGSGEVPIWVTDGIYNEFAGGISDSDLQKNIFAGAMSPFIKAINAKA